MNSLKGLLDSRRIGKDLCDQLTVPLMGSIEVALILLVLIASEDSLYVTTRTRLTTMPVFYPTQQLIHILSYRALPSIEIFQLIGIILSESRNQGIKESNRHRREGLRFRPL